MHFWTIDAAGRLVRFYSPPGLSRRLRRARDRQQWARWNYYHTEDFRPRWSQRTLRLNPHFQFTFSTSKGDSCS